jgi:hypothetical protein
VQGTKNQLGEAPIVAKEMVIISEDHDYCLIVAIFDELVNTHIIPKLIERLQD